ncbi:MAG: hypothetical protein H6Q87_697, partial [candidate division NC10 bacterium]|nr:hypothetical protein [candidate division NC10 bacterium]
PPCSWAFLSSLRRRSGDSTGGRTGDWAIGQLGDSAIRKCGSRTVHAALRGARLSPAGSFRIINWHCDGWLAGARNTEARWASRFSIDRSRFLSWSIPVSWACCYCSPNRREPSRGRSRFGWWSRRPWPPRQALRRWCLRPPRSRGPVRSRSRHLRRPPGAAPASENPAASASGALKGRGFLPCRPPPRRCPPRRAQRCHPHVRCRSPPRRRRSRPGRRPKRFPRLRSPAVSSAKNDRRREAVSV